VVSEFVKKFWLLAEIIHNNLFTQSIESKAWQMCSGSNVAKRNSSFQVVRQKFDTGSQLVL